MLTGRFYSPRLYKIANSCLCYIGSTHSLRPYRRFFYLGYMQRSKDAEQYRVLYNTKHWQSVRQTVLTRDRFTCQHNGCGVALEPGRDRPNSAVVHHIVPHKGNLELFFEPDNLQSVCWTCHSGPIQREEIRGFSTEISESGWPTDPRHPGK